MKQSQQFHKTILKVSKQVDYDSICTMCKGLCCRGGTGGIAVTVKDVKRLANHMNIRPKTFRKKYVNESGHMESQPCPMWKNGCTVYSARPQVCRTFPIGNPVVGLPCLAGHVVLSIALHRHKVGYPAHPQQEICESLMESKDYAKEIIERKVKYHSIKVK